MGPSKTNGATRPSRRRSATKRCPFSANASHTVSRPVARPIAADYWQGHCPLTGITDPALLRASHIIPWSDCDSDGERLNVHNGLLLSALWDAAFDRALVTFDDEGNPEFSSALSAGARAELRWHSGISLTDEHRLRLKRHRERAKAQQ
jgi:predicted restriction endonuclease